MCLCAYAQGGMKHHISGARIIGSYKLDSSEPEESDFQDRKMNDSSRRKESRKRRDKQNQGRGKGRKQEFNHH